MKRFSVVCLSVCMLIGGNYSCAMESKTLEFVERKERAELIDNLYAIGAFKFGKFKLKSEQESPIYVDLRPVISYPGILKSLTQQMCNKIDGCERTFNIVCGVPYGALALATRMAADWELPMIIRRNDPKDHGIPNMIYGHFKEGDPVLLVEDVVTTGGSVSAVAAALKKEGLKVYDIAVCLDREQKGRENLEKEGYRVHALFTITEIINELFLNNRIDCKQYNIVKEYLSAQS